MRSCAYCGTDISHMYKRRRYCTISCSKTHYWERRRDGLIDASPRRSQSWIAERQERLEQQGGLCAICQTEIMGLPHLDHDHETGKTRGVLCVKCNAGLGFFKDNPELLRAALAYLEGASV
jgi:hypothetical protein